MLLSPRLAPILRHLLAFFSTRSGAPPMWVAYAQSEEDSHVQVLGVFLDPDDAYACAKEAIANSDTFLAQELCVVESPLFARPEEYRPGLFVD